MAAAGVVLGGCASRGAMGPAKAISADLSSLHADLSTFQDRLTGYQAGEQIRTGAMAARRDAASAVIRQAQDEQAVLAAKTSTELLGLLQTQGRDETTRALAVADVARPPEVKLPLDKLAETAKSTGVIAKGAARKAEIQSLIRYAGDVNKSLSAVEKKAAGGAGSGGK
jgi:hypothetical protein